VIERYVVKKGVFADQLATYLPPRKRSFSPFSKRTVTPWVEERIREGTLDGLRAAILVDPTNMRLAAHFGRRLADYALSGETGPAASRRARAEADFQTRRALQLAPENDEVKRLRGETVMLLHFDLPMTQ
jgi:hypothetical protein